MFKDMDTREDTRTPPNKGDDVEQNLWGPSGVSSGERFINTHHDYRGDVYSDTCAYPKGRVHLTPGKAGGNECYTTRQNSIK